MNKLLLVVCALLLSIAPSAYAEEPIVLATTTPGVPILEASTTPTIPEVPVLPRDMATSTTVVSEPSSTTTPALEPIASKAILLTIATTDGILFDGPLLVPSCLPDDLVIHGYCALEASGVPVTWSWYGNDAFLNTLGGVGNDYTNGTYWNWFSGHTYGSTALNKHGLSEGESLIVTIGPLPLMLAFNPDTPIAGSTTTVSVRAFAFDANFEPIWVPAEGSTIEIQGESFQTEAGGVYHFVPSEGPMNFLARKEGYLSASMTKNVAAVPIVDSSTGNSDTGRAAGPNDPVAAARAFLLSHQRTDGSFANALLTDWVAIALASTNTSPRLIKEYLASASIPRESATDLERRSMALAALGINPYKVIEDLVKEFDGTQIGNASLINDDIFGIIALTHAGYTKDDAIIERTVATLLARQGTDGSFQSTDLTAAAIQALVQVDSLPGVKGALERARAVLMARQQPDGCFGNSFATSWSIMAIVSLDESSDAWRSVTGNTPLSCLRALQSLDGGFEAGSDADLRVWATAYALPALQQKDWHSLLRSYPQRAKVEKIEVVTGNTEETTAVVPELVLEQIPEPVVDSVVIAATKPVMVQEPLLGTVPSTNLLAGVAAASLENQREVVPGFLEQWFSVWRGFFRAIYERLFLVRL